MTVTREQAQMLATLAIACRPYRAPTWDEAGVMAAIGRVRDRSLAEVALAVIRAAADRECASPGVIPSNGSHWQEQLKPPKWEPTVIPTHDRCGVCSEPKARCRQIWTDDHEFRPIADHKRDPDVIASIVGAVREASHEPVDHQPDHEPTTEGTDRVAPVRAALAEKRADTEEDA